jgi:hypothetical protein
MKNSLNNNDRVINETECNETPNKVLISKAM